MISIAKTKTIKMSSFNTGNGWISIDDQVIVGYITEEVHKIKGVSKMISSISDNFSKNIFGRDSGMNGVRINRDGDNISINLHIIVYYGYNIPQLSYEIQSAIKNVIEEFTGLKVDAVNISVEGIDQEND